MYIIPAPLGSPSSFLPRFNLTLIMSKNELDMVSPTGNHDNKEKNLAVQHFDRHSDDHTMTDGDHMRKGGEDRFDHVLSPEERATALKLAMEADPGPNILSGRYMLFVFTAFIAILNSGDNGESRLSIAPVEIHLAPPHDPRPAMITQQRTSC